jgi:hypothetical protein
MAVSRRRVLDVRSVRQAKSLVEESPLVPLEFYTFVTSQVCLKLRKFPFCGKNITNATQGPGPLLPNPDSLMTSTFTDYFRFHLVQNFHKPAHVADIDSTISVRRQRAAGQEVNV